VVVFQSSFLIEFDSHCWASPGTGQISAPLSCFLKSFYLEFFIKINVLFSKKINVNITESKI
jgi:hypothetical protein